jgi:hypothetical protein
VILAVVVIPVFARTHIRLSSLPQVDVSVALIIAETILLCCILDTNAPNTKPTVSPSFSPSLHAFTKLPSVRPSLLPSFRPTLTLPTPTVIPSSITVKPSSSAQLTVLPTVFFSGDTATHSGSSSSSSSSAGAIAGGVVAGVVIVVAVIVFIMHRNGWKVPQNKKVAPLPNKKDELPLNKDLSIVSRPVEVKAVSVRAPERSTELIAVTAEGGNHNHHLHDSDSESFDMSELENHSELE